MRKHILSIAFIVLALITVGQNTIRFSQFNMTKSIYNPGALAADASLTADLVYRNQWAGVDGAPSTIGFNAAYELTEEMAVGINFYNDRIGLAQNNSISAMYSYRIVFDQREYLAFGLGFGADNISNGLSEATTIVAGDPAFGESYSQFNMNGSFGIYYQTPTFYAGASIPQLFQNTITGPETGFRPDRWHYMAITGFYFELSDNFIFNPNIQIKATKYAPLQGDLLLRGIANNFGFTVGYRSENSLIAGLDYTFANKFRIGYSFNYDVGALTRTKGMSHEVYLGLGLPYYFNSDVSNKFGKRKYIGKKGGSKHSFKRRYQRNNRKS